jgi:hypothetical protein
MEAFQTLSLVDAAPAPASPTAAAIAAFGSSLTGSIVLPDDPAYDAAREIHNSRFDRHPAFGVRVPNPEDVAAAVPFAGGPGNDLPLRCGRHSL